MKHGFAADLIAWYRHARRELPWRATRDPYRIWLSEIMLQQTQVNTVLPYYERFLEAFPTIEALAAAPQERVLKLWEGLGYYARCRRMHEAARHVVDEHEGRFPSDFEAVEALPGIGRSTAGAILTFAYRQRHPLLDGNVKRVLARVFDVAGEISRAATLRSLWSHSAALLEQADEPDTFNQALMELGAVVCTPRSPECGSCPVQRHCDALANGTRSERPVKRKRRKVPHYHIAVGLIWDGDRLLIQRRPSEAMLGGLWEFPGGKQKAGETLPAAVAREVREELGLDVEVEAHLATVDHAYSHFRITLHAYHCRYRGGAPEPRASQAVRWVEVGELDDYAFPKANRRVLEALASVGGGRTGGRE